MEQSQSNIYETRFEADDHLHTTTNYLVVSAKSEQVLGRRVSTRREE